MDWDNVNDGDWGIAIYRLGTRQKHTVERTIVVANANEHCDDNRAEERLTAAGIRGQTLLHRYNTGVSWHSTRRE